MPSCCCFTVGVASPTLGKFAQTNTGAATASAGINWNVYSSSVTMAHELGHILGLTHLKTENKECNLNEV